MTVIPGHYYDGRSARRVEASLAVAGGQVRILSGETILRPDEPLSGVEVSSRLAHTPRSLSFADGARFETADNDAVDHLMSRSGRAGIAHGLVDRLESSLKYVALALVITVLCVWAGVRYGVPALAEVAAHAMPAEVGRSLDRGALEILDSQLFRPSTLPEAEQARLREVFGPLMAEVPPGFEPRVLFRDAAHSLGPNALALPSGTLIFTDQLVEMARDDRELQAVLAHEIGHVVHRHGLRQTLQGSMLTLAAVVVLGDVSSLSSLMVGLPVLLTELGYSRGFEREADAFAVQTMSRHGIKREHFGEILTRMETAGRCPEENQDCPSSGEGRWEGYLSTHPSTPERLRRIQDLPG
ncbi:MAG TPA: M48 family metallopeptidase [Thioalkalivibrio sp.]|nr:M48 family metallopeptidase [Thioalkalivibrio sp.]